MKATAMSRHLGLIALVVPDYDLAIAHYCGDLGFELVEDTRLSEHKRWVVVRPSPLAQTAILLAKAANPEQSAAIGQQTGGRVSFFLYTDDFSRDHAAFQKAGLEFTQNPRIEPYGTVAVFRDKFGNLWDLIEPSGPSESPAILA